MITVLNPTDAEYGTLHEISTRVAYLVFADEIAPTTLTPHFHAFCIFKTNQRFHAVKALFPRADIRPCNGTSAECRAYVTKGDLRDGNPTNLVEYGQLPGVVGKTNQYDTFRDWVLAQPIKPSAAQVAYHFPAMFLRNARTQIFIDCLYPLPLPEVPVYRPYQQQLADILDGPVDPRKIYFVVDPVGNSGKSWFAHAYYKSRPGAVQILSGGKRDDLAFAIDEHKSVFLFDLPRSTFEFFQYPILEQLKNGLIFSNKYESRMKTLTLLHPHIVVFSNEYPDLGTPTTPRNVSADRPVLIVWHNPN